MDNGITFFNEKNAIKFMNSLIKEGIDFDFRYDDTLDATEYVVYILNDDEEDEEENE